MPRRRAKGGEAQAGAAALSHAVPPTVHPRGSGPSGTSGTDAPTGPHADVRPRRSKATADRRDLSQRRVVQAVRPGPVRTLVWDSARVGLGIDLAPTGKRSWIFQYRTRAGVSRRLRLGDADVVTPHQASALYAAALAEVLAGRDPLQARREERQAHASAVAMAAATPVATVADAADRYLARLARDRSPRHAAESARLWAKHLAPTVGPLPLAALTVPTVQALHDAMRDTPTLANRVMALVSSIVARADRDGVWPVGLPNPAQKVERYPETPRARYVTASEWPRLAEALAGMRAELADVPPWDTRPAQVAALVLIMLTGARKEAVMRRRWEDLDTAEAVLAVTPAQKGVDAIVLGRAALAWLAAWRRRQAAALGVEAVDAAAFMFPGQARAGRRASPISTVDVAWDAIRTRAGLHDVRVHDLRRTFATEGGSVELTDHVVGGLLGHVVPGVTGRYAKRAPEVLREAADRVSTAVAQRLGLEIGDA
jgi:integrase